MTTASAPGLAAHPAAAAATRVPAGFFAMVFGLGGLAGAWRAASRAYGVSPWLADALLAISATLWLALFAAQVVKLARARERLAEELAHPIQGSLAALGPASLLLLAAGTAVHFRDLAVVLFYVGAAAQLALGVYLVGRWLLAPIEPKLVTPALYLPPVAGNLLSAIAAGAVGHTDAGWLFFGAGLVAWLLVGAALLVRYLSEGELPAAAPGSIAGALALPLFVLANAVVAAILWQTVVALSRGKLLPPE